MYQQDLDGKLNNFQAPMAELADAPDLGSGPNRVWVRVPLGAGKGGKAGRAFRSFSLSPL